MTTEEDVRDALHAQGIERPGPYLIRLVMDSAARAEEGMPAGERTHRFDDVALLEDTPELADRLGPPGAGDPAGQASYALAAVRNEASAYLDARDS